MPINEEITRITQARNSFRNTGVSLGVALDTDNLTQLAEKFSDIDNQGAVQVTVQEGETYTIPSGYHNGSGTVSGVGGGGDYTLQQKTVTPTKSEQDVSPDQGYYGLSSVTVEAIPDAYQDVTSVNAVAADVLATKTFMPSSGILTAGTMPNNGGITGSINGLVNVSYTIPAGYHDGTGTVSLTDDIEQALAEI